MQNGSIPVKRLQFEDELLGRIRSSGPARQRVGFRLLVYALVCVLAAGGVAAIALKLPALFRRNSDLVRSCHVVIDALRTNQLEDAVALCAEGDVGRRLLEGDDQRTLRAYSAQNPPSAQASETRRPTCLEFLDAVRADLAEEGVVWEAVRPLAFGGIQAKVIAPETMRKPAVSISGAIYFLSGGRIYALELTARRCKKGVVITDFWKCAPVNADADKLKQHSLERFRVFRHEPPKTNERFNIHRSRHVFVSLMNKE